MLFEVQEDPVLQDALEEVGSSLTELDAATLSVTVTVIVVASDDGTESQGRRSLASAF